MKPTYTIYTVGVLAQVAGLDRVWDNSQGKVISLKLGPALCFPSRAPEHE